MSDRSPDPWLREPCLEARGLDHGFGTRAAAPPPDVVRPRQVHGAAVAEAVDGAAHPERADAILAARGGPAVAVATADCVPVLLAAPGGEAVAAVHAGWRGLAAGVVEAGVEALARRVDALRDAPLRSGGGRGSGVGAQGSGVARAALVAGIGPHVGPCCYEVDAPVVEALRRRFGRDLDPVLAPSRRGGAGHVLLDLGALARAALLRAGLAAGAIGAAAAHCTRCDADRFPSYRRDGPGAGRVVHYVRPGVVARAAPPRPGAGVDTSEGPT